MGNTTDDTLKILAVDISQLARSAFEVHGGDTAAMFSTVIEQVTRAREGFDRVAVCCDAGPSFRRALMPTKVGEDGRARGYKANRTPPPQSFYASLDRAIERLAADGCVVFKAPRVGPEYHRAAEDAVFYAEADDVIGSLARWAGPMGYPVRIVSTDSDVLQLLGKRADAVRPNIAPPLLDGETEAGFVWTPAHVLKKFGVAPERIADLKALAGDPSDGYKAFPGIGSEAALAMLKEYGDATSVAQAISEKAEPLKAILKQAKWATVESLGAEPLMLCLSLAEIRRDLDMPFRLLIDPPVVANVSDAAPDPGLDNAPSWDAAPSAEAPAVGSSAIVVKREDASPLARYEGERSAAINPLAFQPRDLGELWRVSKAFFDSRMYPQFPNPQAIMVVGIEAGERGIPLGTALRNAYVVNGRPAWSASFLAALVIASPVCLRFEIVESTETKAVLAYQRKDHAPGTFEFTIEEARKAGWIKSGSKWMTNPRTMLRWAAMREGGRAFFQDAVSNMYTDDELRGDVDTDGGAS